MQGLQIIEQSGALLPEDMQFLKDNIAQVNENWEKKQRFRTETEMLFSVLNDFKHPTPEAKYWQAVREQSVQYEELIRLTFEYRRNDVEIRKLEKSLLAEKDEDERDLKKIDLEEKEFNKVSYEAVAKDRMREIRLWQVIMNEITEDTDFDTDDVNTHQAESHFLRMQNAAAQINEHTPPAERTNALGQYHSIVNRIASGRLGDGKLKVKKGENGVPFLEKESSEPKLEEISDDVRTR